MNIEPALQAINDQEHFELTAAEERALREQEARRLLGMSADEFLRAWEAEAFEGPDTPDVIRVAMLFRLV